jgi:hypothetical protein
MTVARRVLRSTALGGKPESVDPDSDRGAARQPRETILRQKLWHDPPARSITHPMRTVVSLLGLLVLSSTACKHNTRAQTTVRQRAAFDFACSPRELTLTVLDAEGARDMASQISVQGCGKKAVYVYYPDTDTWILDGVVAASGTGDQARSQGPSPTVGTED